MFCGVLVTCPREKAESIAKSLLEKHLAVCINIVPKVSSLFRWKDQIVQEIESLLLIKTKLDRFDDLINQIQVMHPYEIPEIIALPLLTGLSGYLDWVDKETKC